jgi:hypothetical protein
MNVRGSGHMAILEKILDRSQANYQFTEPD